MPDSLGNYTIKIKAFGNYKIAFKSADKKTFTVSASFTRAEAAHLRSREYVLPLNIVLLPRQKKSNIDEYNGSDIVFKDLTVSARPYKRYLQLCSRKYRC